MIAAWIIATAGIANPEGELRLSSLFTDHMVLQRSQTICVKGYARPSAKVQVQFAEEIGSTVADSLGNWSIKFKPRPAGGPFTLLAKSGKEAVSASDILVGEVWVCSGQSNMEWPVAKCAEADEIRKNISPKIRLFKVKQVSSEFEKPEVQGEWNVGDPKGINRWTGVGTSFAIDLHSKLQVPIGIIQATWGGTRIESWMSTRALNRVAVLQPLIQDYRLRQTNFADKLAKWQAEANAWDALNEKQDTGNEGYDKGWAKLGFDDSSWNRSSLPGSWESEEGREVDGAIWYRKQFQIPQEWTGKGLRIRLGFVGTDDQTYVNGLKVGSTLNKDSLRAYYIGPGVLKEGINQIAIRVWNRSGEGGVLGPTLDIAPAEATSPMSLAGEWKSKVEKLIEVSDREYEARPIRPLGPGDRNALAGAYNGMISPIQFLPIKGVLWYQGEANVDRPDQYAPAFNALIDSWRKEWLRPSLPFLYVQLPGFNVKDIPTKNSLTWARLRQSQDAGLDRSYTGMVVTTDLSDPNTIHPTKKLEVGRRLANLALNRAYEKSTNSFFPLASSFKVIGPTVRVIFQNTYGDLLLEPTQNQAGFELLDSTGKWQPALAMVEGRGINVSSKLVDSPKGVRYNYSDNPIGKLRGGTGLPAAPFIWVAK